MAVVTKTTTVLKPPITVKQWGELDGETRYDLVNGHLKERPDVAFWHEILLGHLFTMLNVYITKNDLGLLVSSNAKLKISRFGGREPDIFFIPRALFHFVGKNLFKGVPPLVIEILSPENEREDRGAKRREYAALGVGEYWIVDFRQRCIEVYQLRRRRGGKSEYELAEVVRGKAVFRPKLFPGLRITLAKISPTEFENRTDD